MSGGGEGKNIGLYIGLGVVLRCDLSGVYTRVALLLEGLSEVYRIV